MKEMRESYSWTKGKIFLNYFLEMESTVFSVLPIDQWQEARIIQFKYNRCLHPCYATIVYFFPVEITVKKHDTQLLEDLIVESLKIVFGEVNVWKREVFFDNIKNEMKRVFDGGRPSVNLVVRMIPEIPVDHYEKYVDKVVYAYDYKMNIFLDSLEQPDMFSNDLLITAPFTLGQEELIKWGANSIETL